MSKYNRHILRRSIIELDMPRHWDHQQIQSQVAKIFREKLIPVLTQILEEHCGPSVDMRLDQLVLELGTIERRFLEVEFLGKFSEKLEKELKKALEIKAAEHEGSAPETSEPGDQMQLLQWFFETGTLPWWAKETGPSVIRESLLALAENAPATVGALLQSCAQRPGWLDRLVLTLPDHAMLRITALAFSHDAQAIVLLMPHMRDLLLAASPRGRQAPQQLRKSLWRGLIHAAGGDRTPQSLPALTRALLHCAAETCGESVAALAGKCTAQLQGADRFPPEAMASIREMADTGPQELPQAVLRSQALQQAQTELAKLLRAEGLDLARLEAIAPVLRHIFTHTNDAYLHDLLRRLSKFMSPYLDKAQNHAVQENRKRAPMLRKKDRELSQAEEPATVEHLVAELANAEQTPGFASLAVHTQKALQQLMQLLRRWLSLQATALQPTAIAKRHPATVEMPAGQTAVEKARLALCEWLETELNSTELLVNHKNKASASETAAVWNAQLRLVQQQMHRRRSALVHFPLREVQLALENLVTVEAERAALQGQSGALAPYLDAVAALAETPELRRLRPLLLGFLEAGDLPLAAWNRLGQGLQALVKAEAANHERLQALEQQFQGYRFVEIEEGKVATAGEALATEEEMASETKYLALVNAEGEKLVGEDGAAVLHLLQQAKLANEAAVQEWGRKMAALAGSFLPVLPHAEFRPQWIQLIQVLKRQAGQVWLHLHMPVVRAEMQRLFAALEGEARRRFDDFYRLLAMQGRACMVGCMVESPQEMMRDLEEVVGMGDPRSEDEEKGRSSNRTLLETLLARTQAGRTWTKRQWEDWRAMLKGESETQARGDAGAAQQQLETKLLRLILAGFSPDQMEGRIEIEDGEEELSKASAAKVVNMLRHYATGAQKTPDQRHLEPGDDEKKSLRGNTQAEISDTEGEKAAQEFAKQTHRKQLEDGQNETLPFSEDENHASVAADAAESTNSPAEIRKMAALKRELEQYIAGLLREVLPPQIRQRLLALRKQLHGGQGTAGKASNLHALQGIRQGLDHLSEALDDLVLRNQDPLAGTESDTLSESDALYTGNAGLVLVWPFFARFFAKLGLTEKDKFISLEAQQQAVLILEYLVQGETELAEHMLPLNKLMCGYPLQKPLPVELTLNKEIVEECNMLLKVVPSHNPMMKNLSAEGFRSSWLQREGVIKAKDDYFILHVEGKPYDILLDQLPWAVQTVKLPWMDHILTVEW